jgi:hypothetical protein
MPESVKEAPSAPTPVMLDEREGPVLFAPNDALENLLRAEAARRFDDLRSSLREAIARCAPRSTQLQYGSLSPADARARAATKYYEQHVLAWYALGRIPEACSARAAMLQCRQALAAEARHTANRATGQRTAATPADPRYETTPVLPLARQPHRSGVNATASTTVSARD